MVTRASAHTPVPVGSLPAFTPVPRKRERHDGWTPERQRAFVAALADTGCVSIACRMVNMSQPSHYHLRRQPGAESFRAAADAAHTLGLQVVKDEAFDRALHGQLVPVFVGGKLMGFRRKKNDRLLMFILRHYGQDAQGRKTTINYFSTRATAGAAATPLPLAGEGEPRSGEGEGMTGETRTAALAAAEASTTTVKTIISGNAAPSRLAADDEAAAVLNAFEGVALDAEAHEEIARALEACAARRRMLDPDCDTPLPDRLARQAEDEQCDFIRVAPGSVEYLGELEGGAGEEFVPFTEGEPPWEQIGAPVPEWFQQWQEREDARQAAAAALPSPSTGEGQGAGDPSVRPEPVEGPSLPSPQSASAEGAQTLQTPHPQAPLHPTGRRGGSPRPRGGRCGPARGGQCRGRTSREAQGRRRGWPDLYGRRL